MTHRIYTTEAIVLATQEAGDGTQMLSLFTSDLGLIFARAQGLRELKSKLRYSLQLFSSAKVSLVRGREMWRVISAEPDANLGVPSTEPIKLSLIARIASLVIRLVRGEEIHSELFVEYKSSLVFFSQASLSPEQLRAYELILVLRLLHQLGYIERRQELLPLLNFANWSEEILVQTKPIELLMVEVINQALHHSHL